VSAVRSLSFYRVSGHIQRAVWNSICSREGTQVDLIHKKFVISQKGVAAVVALVAAIVSITIVVKYRSVTLHGAVIRKSDDPLRETPVAGVEIDATDGSLLVQTKSDSTGAFAVTVRRSVIRRHPLTLTFRHPDYRPSQIFDPRGDRLYIVNMNPIPAPTPPAPDQPQIHIGNVSVRYTLKMGAVVDVGSGVKTFEVVNTGDVPCNGHRPCSPDGKWKAAIVSASLDAGPENEFRDGRVSCIAGPCPFTKVERDNFSQGGRVISVTIRNWSDTTTFLLQAEAVRHVLSDATRKSYPVVFGRTMNFSLPVSAEGTCIEAEVDGTPIVFPIVPNLSLSWASCDIQSEPENNKLYRCELKPGYVFR
jgi:hypothetical protein